jgi:3-oxoacyl-(acyl-carrier-protein) synthase/acyl carrier protein
LPNVVARPVLEADYRPPQGDVERILTNLWQQVLGLDRVGTADNFFDLGGDSLKLARVQSALRTSLHRDIPILDLFRFPTIAALAAHLAQDESAPAAPRRRAARPAAGDDAIAVIGMAGRFPGADSVEQLWKNICAGKESISFFDDAELDTPPPPADGGVTFVKARSVLDRCEWFDAAFFGYGPRDAELMDPQHRVFLECAWEALEHAGCDPARYAGNIGVVASCSLNTYLMYNVLATRAAVNDLAQSFQVGGYQTLVGNDKDYVASRVAYKLNLRGPGFTVQSACSSSLVGICQAAQNLASGLCDIALAGGVSITFPQKRGYPFVEGSIGSADGHCRPFDASASGTVFGSGVGIVVLKRLADAQADGDTIYAVLKGWALNNDGGVRAGYMAPSAEGQAEVIRMALDRANVDARTIGFVETHGTGTPLGDPIEVAGLTRAFRLSTPDTGFCALGSIKANIGHIESASGATGLIKAVLALYHRQIPPAAALRAAEPADRPAQHALLRLQPVAAMAGGPGPAAGRRQLIRRRRHQRAHRARGSAGARRARGNEVRLPAAAVRPHRHRARRGRGQPRDLPGAARRPPAGRGNSLHACRPARQAHGAPRPSCHRWPRPPRPSPPCARTGGRAPGPTRAHHRAAPWSSCSPARAPSTPTWRRGHLRNRARLPPSISTPASKSCARCSASTCAPCSIPKPARRAEAQQQLTQTQPRAARALLRSSTHWPTGGWRTACNADRHHRPQRRRIRGRGLPGRRVPPRGCPQPPGPPRAASCRPSRPASMLAVRA